MSKTFTGIGTRHPWYDECRFELLQMDIGKLAAKDGYRFKSGGADFSDFNYHNGYVQGGGKDDIIVRSEKYRHFKNPRGARPTVWMIQEEEFEIALAYFVKHGIFKLDKFRRMSDFAQNAHARNYFQIMSAKGDKPDTDFVSYLAKEDRWGNVSGGTRTAVAVARCEDVPVFNINNPKELNNMFRRFL